MLVALAICIPSVLRAGEPQATAKLSEASGTVGEPVQFQITVSGARNAQPPQDIKVDGLNITYSGQSTQVQMMNFDVKMSIIFTYNVLPQRVGRFTIPAQTIEVGGRRLATEPVTLVVSGTGGGTAATQGGGADRGLAFAEILLPRETAFVGETIPAELRIYVDSRAHWQFAQPPQLQGDGFTAQKLSEPVQNEVQKGGRSYDLVIFKTAITPAKTGTISLGPFEINTVAQLPQQRRQRPRFGIDDFDSLFGDPFGSFARPQKVDFKSEPVQLQVRALPPNAPSSFSGAIGQFTMSVATNPTNVKLGDPLTLTIKINGRGNFDRVNAPKLAEETGWRSYPASGTFKAEDNVGISGTKTFEMAVIPEEKKSQSPAVKFTYFDPLTEKYVTLDGQQIPIIVQGEKAPSVASAPASTPAPSAAATPAPQVADIHYIRTEAGEIASFKPLYLRREFWLAQTVPLVALICFVGFGIRQRKATDLRAHQLAELRREKTALMRTLREENDGTVFYDTAARYIQLETAMRTGREPSLIDVQAVCEARPLDAETADRIRSIFEARSEALYAGHGMSGSVSCSEKARVLDAIEKLEHSHA